MKSPFVHYAAAFLCCFYVVAWIGACHQGRPVIASLTFYFAAFFFAEAVKARRAIVEEGEC